MKYLVFLILFLPSLSRSQTDFETAEKWYKVGNYNLAKPVFEKIARENPKHYKSIEYLGDIAGFSYDWNLAMSYFKTLKTAKPNDADVHFKYGVAISMIAKGNKFKAISLVGDIKTSFEKAIFINPKHVDSHWALIEYYLQVPAILGGSQQKATYYANQLASISNVDGYLSKGRIAEHYKRYHAAEKYYRKAIDAGHSKTTYQRLADLYKNKMNSPEKARAVLEEYANKR